MVEDEWCTIYRLVETDGEKTAGCVLVDTVNDAVVSPVFGGTPEQVRRYLGLFRDRHDIGGLREQRNLWEHHLRQESEVLNMEPPPVDMVDFITAIKALAHSSAQDPFIHGFTNCNDDDPQNLHRCARCIIAHMFNRIYKNGTDDGIENRGVDE